MGESFIDRGELEMATTTECNVERVQFSDVRTPATTRAVHMRGI